MAPEVVSEGELDARTDLFSLGAMMYHMVTGCVPFEGKTAIATLHKISTGNFMLVRQRAPDCPAALAEIIEKLLSHKPDDRFQSASQLKVALKGLRRNPNQPTKGENNFGRDTSAAD